jgi:hypothetical protein
MIFCLYFYCKATSELKDFEVVFGEWAKRVGGNLKGVVSFLRVKKIDDR